MSDISLCKNHLCPLSDECKRFNTVPHDIYQSYQDFEPDDDGNCDFFIQMPDSAWHGDSDL